MRRCALSVMPMLMVLGQAAAPLPAAHNPYGAHLLIVPPGDIEKQVTWAHTLVGDGGHVKCFFTGITADTKGARPEWVALLNEIYQQNMTPLVRLAGTYRDGQWIKPAADAPGDYSSMAAAVKAVVSGLPRKEGVPLYIEVWNEPNLDLEWSGQASAEEYGRFLVAVYRAIESIGDERIKVLNGGLATSPEFAREMFTKVPESARAFDLWASHPYPQNHPPEYNIHDKTASYPDCTIDSYELELAVVREFRGRDVPVMLTETGYNLGNQTYGFEGYPMIDEQNRADYIMRAFRDYWSKWPEVVAVFPFEFCDAGGGWSEFNWVYPDSETDARGWPTKRHLQYDYIAALAKPNDATGCISGTLFDPATGETIRQGKVTAKRGQSFFSPEDTAPAGTGRASAKKGSVPFLLDSSGNFILPALAPGPYGLRLRARNFRARWEQPVVVKAGENAVVRLPARPVGYGAVSGIVREAGTDRGLADVKLLLGPGKHRATSNMLGEFVLQRVLPGRYELGASLPGYGPHRVSALDVGPDEEKTVFLHIGRFAASGPMRNLLRNPGFEQAETAGVGLGWSAPGLQAPERRCARDTSFARSGSASQRVSLRGDAVQIAQMSDYNTVEAGKAYVASAWVAPGEPLPPKLTVTLRAAFLTNGGQEISSVVAEKKPRAPSTWTPLVVRGVAPEGAKRMYVVLRAAANSGDVHWDDVYAGMAAM